MGEVAFWRVCFVLWQEGRQHWGRRWWARGPEGGGWTAGGSQRLCWRGHLWDFALSELSSPSSQDCSDDKCSSGNLTFSSLVTRSLWKTINFYQNCYFLEKRSLLFKKGDFFVCFYWLVLLFSYFRRGVQRTQLFQGASRGAINQRDMGCGLGTPQES